MFARRSFTSLTRAGESSSNRGIVNGLLSTFNTTDNTESSNTSLFSNQQDNGIYIRNMATLKEIKNRKVSVENIEKITASMKMVAAAKLKGVEKDLDRARSYIKGTDAFFSKVETNGVPEAEEGKRNLVVALTSDRGLCGGVNSTVVRTVKNNILSKNMGDVKFVIVGEKGVAGLQKIIGKHINSTFSGISKDLNFLQSAMVANQILQMEWDTLTFVYNQFESVISFDQRIRSFPSLASLKDQENRSEEFSAYVDKFEYEDDCMDSLYEFHLANTMFYCLTEVAASETSARMTAMDNATRNAGEMIDALEIQYNRTRQAVITTELIEIISGAAALE